MRIRMIMMSSWVISSVGLVMAKLMFLLMNSDLMRLHLMIIAKGIKTSTKSDPNAVPAKSQRLNFLRST
jgi:hypothetical protein